MDEGELLRRWAEGDKAAGKQLVEAYYAPISRFFRNKVEDSGDLVQRTFLACLESAGRYRAEGNFRSFLFGIAFNVLRKHLRDRPNYRQLDGEDQPSIAGLDISPSEVIAVRQEQRLLLAALRHLPVDLQMLLELHYWEQMKVDELAELFEVPPGTIKSRMRRGRQLLEQSLEKLAASPAEFHSTLGGLDRWADELRQLIPGR